MWLLRCHAWSIAIFCSWMCMFCGPDFKWPVQPHSMPIFQVVKFPGQSPWEPPNVPSVAGQLLAASTAPLCYIWQPWATLCWFFLHLGMVLHLSLFLILMGNDWRYDPFCHWCFPCPHTFAKPKLEPVDFLLWFEHARMKLCLMLWNPFSNLNKTAFNCFLVSST